MVGAFNVERFDDVLRWSFFAGMRNKVKAGITGDCKRLGEFAWRVVNLGAVEANPDELMEVVMRCGKSCNGFRARKVPQKAHDESGGNAEFGLCLLDCSPKTSHEYIESDASFAVGLRIEEDLGSPYAVGMNSVKICLHEIEEIQLGQKNRSALAVDVEK